MADIRMHVLPISSVIPAKANNDLIVVRIYYCSVIGPEVIGPQFKEHIWIICNTTFRSFVWQQ